jgi:hypothetical protein
MTRTMKAIFICLTASLLLFSNFAFAETVSLPLSIDHRLLRTLLIKDAFTGPEKTAVLLNEQGGCNKVILSEPRYTLENNRILLETKVFVRAGFYVAGTCILPITWEGYVSLTQVPVINERWVLSFKTIESKVYDKNHKTARIIGLVWDLITTHVLEYLGHITVNLAPPVEELRAFLREVFPSDLQDRAQRMVDGLRPGKVDAGPEAVMVEILMEAERAAGRDAAGEHEPLTPEEMEKFIAVWETWDAYLVHMITSLPEETLVPEERKVLLDILLETRHRFVDELLQPRDKEDFVRKEFVVVWNRLAPFFRKRMIDDPARPLLDYLAFITASDALVILNRTSPHLGIEISRNGLIRLARLISGQEITDLPYQYGVNRELRDHLGLGAPLPDSGPSYEGESLEIDPEESKPEGESALSFIMAFFISTAWAEPIEKQAFHERLGPWLVPKGDIRFYLDRVTSLLNNTSVKSSRNMAFEVSEREFFRRLILSTAWQESCLQQFTVEGGKVTYLQSYNHTSVGIMQINERVWRGIYDEKHLRWDIAYNASAGGEILGIYLKRHALPEIEELSPESRPDQKTLARIVYAMYYGGPEQLKRIRDRLKKGRPNMMDRLFLDKYEWVTGNQWDQIEKCL